MYIRRAQISSSATGEQYYTYRLVHSERSGGKVRQMTLLNLGRYFPIAPEHWSALCRRVEELLAGQASMFNEALPKAIALEAEHIAAQLLAAYAPLCAASSSLPATAVDTAASESATALDPKSTQPVPADFQTVDVASLELARPRSVGVEHAGLAAMRQLGFTELLIELGLSGPLRAAAVGSIIGRMAEPGSEAATYRWLSRHSGLGELLDVDFERMKPITLYRASDALMKHRDIIERTLFNRVHDLFGFETTVTLYDLTNTYFEGTAAANPKAQRGRSKDMSIPGHNRLLPARRRRYLSFRSVCKVKLLSKKTV